ncbi:MAG TPA: TIGR04283 family arsenosugar biosynthesis glycosyltransferase [Pyrinomonadaceae bacterium]
MSGEAVKLSVIIPALDEARDIGATLDAAARAGACELIVADGGSADATAEVARVRGARVVNAARGRGAQMRAGALAASGDILWFLHADTLAPPDAAARIAEALRDPRAVGGNFRVRFDGRSAAAGFLTWLYPRLRLLGLAYGDSAFFVRRAAYERAGGFKPFPIFEDLDLLRALWKQGRFVQADACVVTSSRRFEGRSFAHTFARWSFLQALYWLGVSPHALARLYAHVRRPGPRARRQG